MKKLLALILIAALILPAIALAGENDVIGCWASYTLQKSGTPKMTMLYLAENHVCYFIVQTFAETEASLGRTYVGTWEMNSRGYVVAKIGNNSEMTLAFSESYGAALNVKTNELYINLAKFD